MAGVYIRCGTCGARALLTEHRSARELSIYGDSDEVAEFKREHSHALAFSFDVDGEKKSPAT